MLNLNGNLRSGILVGTQGLAAGDDGRELEDLRVLNVVPDREEKDTIAALLELKYRIQLTTTPVGVNVTRRQDCNAEPGILHAFVHRGQQKFTVFETKAVVADLQAKPSQVFGECVHKIVFGGAVGDENVILGGGWEFRSTVAVTTQDLENYVSEEQQLCGIDTADIKGVCVALSGNSSLLAFNCVIHNRKLLFGDDGVVFCNLVRWTAKRWIHRYNLAYPVK